MGGVWREARGYVVWGVVVAALIALPLVVWLTRDSTTNDVTSLGEQATASASPTPSPSPAADATSLTEVPLCAQVWQAKKTLPDDYAGCQTGGKVVKPTMDYCLVTYDDRFWASPGSAIHRMPGALGDALSAYCGDDYASSASASPAAS